MSAFRQNSAARAMDMNRLPTPDEGAVVVPVHASSLSPQILTKDRKQRECAPDRGRQRARERGGGEG
eukprot:285335-Pleurochrysis_carterae.AAC.2